VTPARFVLLEHAGDPVARALARELAARHGEASVIRLAAELLGREPRWEHYLDSHTVRTVLTLNNAQRLDSAEITAVVNRLHCSTPDHLASEHRDYAAAEVNALLLSWLRSLTCLVLNRPMPRGLAGAELSFPEWLHLAGRSGLSVGDYVFTTDARRTAAAGGGAFACSTDGGLAPDYSQRLPRFGSGRRPAVAAAVPADHPQRLLVIGRRVLGAAPQAVVEASLALAGRVGFGLLELWFATPDWTLAGVQPFPSELSAAEIDMLASVLEGSA
jgi:hypothetical protein